MDTGSSSQPGGAPTVGRDRELATLRKYLVGGFAGAGLVLISGEVGAGKTTLTERFAQEAVDVGTFVAVGHCYDRIETPPYGAWLEILWPFRALPSSGDAPPLPRLETAASQAAFFIQVRDYLAAFAAPRPLLIILEDLHWADTASLDLLRFLAHGLTSLPVLFIVTYRADELDRHHPLGPLVPQLVREAPTERIALHPLDGDAVCALVRGRYDLPGAEARRLAAYLLDRTDGNALFMTELLRTLEEDDILRHEAGGWHYREGVHASVPRLLRQIFDSRLARFDDKAAALLAIAAVLGQEVSLTMWGLVAQVDEDLLLAVADQAEAAHLVTAATSGDGIQFRHALIRDALYESVPTIRRRRIHQQVAEVLATSPSPDPDAVAYHFQRAGNDRAAGWLVRAGERAEDAYALVAAAERYEAALGLLDTQGADSIERGWLRLLVASLCRYQKLDHAVTLVEEALLLAGDTGDASLSARAQVMHGLLMSYRGAHRASMAGLAALDIIERLPPGTGALRRREHHIDAMVNRGTLVNNLAHFGYLTEARVQAEGYLARAGGGASTPAEIGALTGIHGALSVVYALQGEPVQSRQSYAACIAAREAIGDYLSLLGKQREELALVVLPYEADNLAERARVTDAAERTAQRLIDTGALRDTDDPQFVRLPLLTLEGRWREAREIAELPDSSYVTKLLHYRHFVLGTLARAQGDAETAWQCVRETWPEGPAAEPGTRYVAFTVPLFRLAAALELDTGELSSARVWLDAHRRWLDFMGATLGRSAGERLEAEWYRATGDSNRAGHHAREAMRQATKPRQPLALLAAHRTLGVLAIDAAQFDAAHGHLEMALALADACRASHERSLTLLVRAELAAARGDAKAATRDLATARTLCVSIGAQQALAHADRIAGRLGGDAVHHSADPSSLTAREMEVLRLVAAGLRNDEIANRLSLSSRTVKVHVANIFAKIGVHNRAAATQFALHHDLG